MGMCAGAWTWGDRAHNHSFDSRKSLERLRGSSDASLAHLAQAQARPSALLHLHPHLLHFHLSPHRSPTRELGQTLKEFLRSQSVLVLTSSRVCYMVSLVTRFATFC